MITADIARRIEELGAAGDAFATATVVRAQRPTSAQVGAVAFVLPDGTIEGFVGGSCAEHSVRAYSLEAMRTGEPLLLRITPFAEEGVDDGEEGAVTVQNPCLSGGAIEIFVEPVVPSPRLVVAGDTPIAAALRRLGAEVGLDVAAAEDDPPRHGDLAVVVAAHGRDELGALRAALEHGVPYVGLVASRARGDGVLGELRGDGVPDELLARIDVPAGLDIGARTPGEIALSIMSRIVQVRRGASGPAADRPPRAAEPAATAVDPICGMSVAAVPGTPSIEHEGQTVWFCCDGCRDAFAARHQSAANPD
ncbi:MAG: XdhC family protein [Thermoleophilia bacterium]